MRGSRTSQARTLDRRYRRIRTCLPEEVESSSSPIRRQAPDVKYPEKVERRKGDRLRVQGVGTPPPDDTERALLSGATPSGFPRGHVARSLIRTPSGRSTRHS